MNTIVRKNYPVSKLPEDLREGLDLNGLATVVVEPKAEGSLSPGLKALRDYRSTHAPRFRTDEEILAYVRRVRDGDPL